MTLVIDSSKCQGHGRCMLINSDIFDIDDDGYGVVAIAEPGPELATDVANAIENCPERAIFVS